MSPDRAPRRVRLRRRRRRGGGRHGRDAPASALERTFGVIAGEPGRLVPVVLPNGAVVLDDTYNSNPASLESSVTAAVEIAHARGGRLWLVLGEMRELGDDSPRLHREAGAALVGCGAHSVLGVSGDARWLLEPFEKAASRPSSCATRTQRSRCSKASCARRTSCS